MRIVPIYRSRKRERKRKEKARENTSAINVSQRGWAILKGFDKSDFELIPEALRNRTLRLHQTLAWEESLVLLPHHCFKQKRVALHHASSDHFIQAYCLTTGLKYYVFCVFVRLSLTPERFMMFLVVISCSIIVFHSSVVESGFKRSSASSANYMLELKICFQADRMIYDEKILKIFSCLATIPQWFLDMCFSSVSCQKWTYAIISMLYFFLPVHGNHNE